MTLRLQLFSDRLSCRGGADWHLQGILSALCASGDWQLRLAVGRREAGVSAPCPVAVLPALAARTEEPAGCAALLCDYSPDLLHLQNVVNPAVLRWAARYPVVITVQDHRFFCPGRGKWTAAGEPCREPLSAARCRSCFAEEAYFRAIYELTQARLEAISQMTIVVLSDYMRDELVAAGIVAERIHVVPPFVHGFSAEGGETAPAAEPCALFVGRLVAAKGPQEALAAWSSTQPALPLVFAGTGPLRPELEAAGAQVLGWLQRDQLARLYRRAQVLLMPSRWQEPFGIAGLEALRFGVPVAAWDSGGIRQWCPPDGLAPWGDLESLAQRAAVCAEQRSAELPSSFRREALMARLMRVYQGVGG